MVLDQDSLRPFLFPVLLAPEQEVPQPEPERFTPLLYRVQHPLVRFSGGKLVSLIGSEDSETPKCTLASVQVRHLMITSVGNFCEISIL